MPALNPGKYLRASLESLINQTRPLDKIVVIDDGSTDGSFQEIEDLLAHKHVELVTNLENRGKAAALNFEFDRREADYFFLQDADDEALPERVATQLRFMESEKTVGCSSGFIDYINEQGKKIGSGKLNLLTQVDLNRYLASDEPFGLFCPAVVIRASVVKDRNLQFRGQFWPADDIDLWNRIAEAGHGVRAMPTVVTRYRIHGGSVVTAGFMKTRAKFEWLRGCLRARRRGEAEPTEQEFLKEWNSAPVWQKLRRWRRNTAKANYRNAGFLVAEKKVLRAAGYLATAALLQPSYVFGRLRTQLK